jgi:branched-chain amino acid aminotransferase
MVETLERFRIFNGDVSVQYPAPDVNTFVNAVKQTVLANKRWVIFCPH